MRVFTVVYTCQDHVLESLKMAFFVFVILNPKYSNMQGAKKIFFTACLPGKLKLAFTSPVIISTSPKSFLTSRIDFTVLLLFEFIKTHHLPLGQDKNRIH